VKNGRSRDIGIWGRMKTRSPAHLNGVSLSGLAAEGELLSGQLRPAEKDFPRRLRPTDLSKSLPDNTTSSMILGTAYENAWQLRLKQDMFANEQVVELDPKEHRRDCARLTVQAQEAGDSQGGGIPETRQRHFRRVLRTRPNALRKFCRGHGRGSIR